MKIAADILKKANKEYDELRVVNIKLSKTEQEAIYKKMESKNSERIKAENNYNSLIKSMTEKETLIKTLNNKIEMYTKESQNLMSMMGKCDLAWKTLFTDKDWDEIHRRTFDSGKKYTKNKEEDKKEELKPEKNSEKQNPEKGENIEQNETAENTGKSLVKVEKQNVFKRFANMVKKAFANVKSYFNKSDVIVENKEEQLKQDKNEKIEEENRRNEIERIKAEREAKKEKTTQKDSFIDALRVKVDEAYKEDYYKNKELEYAERKKSELANKKIENKTQEKNENEIMI